MTSNPTPSSNTTAHSVITTHPIAGIFGVLLGAMIATSTGRLLSVGLPDLRGALHLGVDEASWIGTAFNAGLMFVGPFSVYLGGLLGARRVLLTCACLFTLISIALPFATQLPVLLVLLLLGGLTAGTFYPLTLSFVLRGLPMRFVLLGIATYAMDIVFTTNLAASLEAWYMGHLSWHWIFWNSAALTPIMFVLIYFGVPWQPLPTPKEGEPSANWRGFLYASFGFALLYIGFDQGQRLDWFHSGTIVGCMSSGMFLLFMTVVRRLRMPNPLINLRFLVRRNTLLLALVLICFRFVMLATVITIPGYLGTVKGYLPLETGPVLLWVALPQCVCGLLAMFLLRHVDARIILTFGFAVVAFACLLNSRLSPAWSGDNFQVSQGLMAVGLAFAFNSMVGAIVLELVNTGALKRPIDTLTFGGFFQTVRLLGGEMGATFMQHFIAVREQFHSNILGLGVNLGNPVTNARLQALRAAMMSRSYGQTSAASRAGELLGLQIKQQAFTLATADSFQLIAWSVACCLILIACMAPVPTQYSQVVQTTAEAA